MLRVEEALERCLSAVRPVVAEEVPVASALGRVLAEDLVSPLDLPPWDNSAMDGYAVRAADLPAGGASCDTGPATDEGPILEVIEVIAAGAAPQRALRPGTCARIYTGAPLPRGADAVVMQEHATRLAEGRVRLAGGARRGQHVRRAGEELRAGEIALRSGHTLGAAALGLCAALGRVTVRVAKRPRVALVSTGDELVPAGEPLRTGQIWSSNAQTLSSLCAEAGAEPLDCGVARDTLESTRAAFGRALEADLIVSTGGVSVGDFDVVRQALAAEEGQLSFWKVQMKPGKPLAFGTLGGRPLFGLPGNPVSCVVNFLQFVRPVIRRSLGDPRPFLPVVDAALAAAVRKEPGRAELVRVTLSWGPGGLVATPTGDQSSGWITSLVRAQGFALLGSACAGVAAGERVPVQVYDPAFGASEVPGYRWAGGG